MAARCAAWQVARPGFKTDPEAHWRDDYRKTFPVFRREEKAGQLQEAKKWVKKVYGITEWGTVPGVPHALFPLEVVVAVKQSLKAAKKEGDKHDRASL